MPETNGNSNGNGHDNSNHNHIPYDICKGVEELNKVLKAANVTYDYIRDRMTEYTQSQFLKSPEEVHIEWLKHMLQLDHPLSPSLVRDFDKQPDSMHFLHIINEPITREMLIQEMNKVYTTWKKLDYAFDFVICDRKLKKSRLLHDLHNNRKNLDTINNFFREQHRYIRINLQEIEDAMKKNNIQPPTVDDEIEYNSNPMLRDWLLASEFLSVVQYSRVLYTKLLQICSSVPE